MLQDLNEKSKDSVNKPKVHELLVPWNTYYTFT